MISQDKLTTVVNIPVGNIPGGL